MLLDTAIAVETPEGVDFTVIPAGVVSRALAYSADFLIRSLIVTIAMIILAFLGDAGIGFGLVIYFLLEWFYPVFFELTRGATPGKKWLHLRVIHDDGTPVTFSSSLLRNLLRAADIMPLFYLLGLIAMLCNSQFKRLGDIAAGTLVVRVAPVKNQAGANSSGVRTPTISLSATEQQAIIQFSQRAAMLSQARREELANILTPVFHLRDAEAVENLDQIANYLLGRAMSLDTLSSASGDGRTFNTETNAADNPAAKDETELS